MCLCAGRWEARIGIPGSKHIYLGLFNLEKEAAQAYDRALVRLRGTAAATNFALSDYRTDLAEYHKMQQVLLHTLPSGPLLSPLCSMDSKWHIPASTACLLPLTQQLGLFPAAIEKTIVLVSPHCTCASS